MDDGQQHHQMQQIYVQNKQARKRKGPKTMMVNSGPVSKYAAARGKKGLTSQSIRMGNTAESMGGQDGSNPL